MPAPHRAAAALAAALFCAMPALTGFAQAPAAAPTPFEPPKVDLTARINTGVKGANISGPLTKAIPWYYEGTIHSFHPPQDGYTVQVFFIGKGLDGQPLMYNAVALKLPGDVARITIPAPPDAAGHEVYALPDLYYVFTQPGMPRSVPPPAPAQVKGLKAVPGWNLPAWLPELGWVVRIYGDNQFVTAIGSRDDITDSVRNNPGVYDQIFSNYTTPAPVAPVAPTPAPTPIVSTGPAEVPQVSLTLRKNPDALGGDKGYPLAKSPIPYFIEGSIRAVHPPADGYTAQVYYVMQGPNGKPLIYYAATFPAPGSAAPVSFPAPMYVNAANMFPLYEEQAEKPRQGGSAFDEVKPVAITQWNYLGRGLGKVYGAQDWIVRIVGGGKVVSIAASSLDMRSSVLDHPAYYDQLFATYPYPTEPPVFGMEQPSGVPAPTPTPVPTPAVAAAPTAAAASNAPVEIPQVQIVQSENPNRKNAQWTRPGQEVPPIYFLEGTIHAFHPPEGGYAVQLFYIAKAPNGKPIIFDAIATKVNGDLSKLLLPTPTSLPGFSLYTLAGDDYQAREFGPTDPQNPVPIVNPAIKNAVMRKIDSSQDWVIRILGGGKVVYLAASDVAANYADSFRDNPDYYEKILDAYTASASRYEQELRDTHPSQQPNQPLVPGLPTSQ